MLSNKTALAMIFKVAGPLRETGAVTTNSKIILGVRFTDGNGLVKSQAQAAAA
jgi:hypothetical protein